MQAEIKYLLFFLQYIVYPTDSGSLYHLLASPIFKLNINLLRQSAAEAKRQNQTFSAVLENSAESDSRLKSALELIAGLQGEMEDLSIGQLCYKFWAKPAISRVGQTESSG